MAAKLLLVDDCRGLLYFHMVVGDVTFIAEVFIHHQHLQERSSGHGTQGPSAEGIDFASSLRLKMASTRVITLFFKCTYFLWILN